jgi:hypothetical protein
VPATDPGPESDDGSGDAGSGDAGQPAAAGRGEEQA